MSITLQRRTVGAVLRVLLPSKKTCFAVTLPEAEFAFFGPEAANDAECEDILRHPMLFRVAVHQSAWSKGRWSKVAKINVPPALLAPEPKFIQDALDPSKFELYIGGRIMPATLAECKGLERAAVWEPEHVEQRLEDHLAGLPNVWVEQLRIK